MIIISGNIHCGKMSANPLMDVLASVLRQFLRIKDFFVGT
jgi:hypothetical protein